MHLCPTSAVDHALAQRELLGSAGDARASTLARGRGWSVDDVICSFGPRDRPFEERHNGASVALVVAGTFQYRISKLREVLVPGALLLGNDGQSFECSHDHAPGDRCIAFRFDDDYLQQIAADAGLKERRFRVGRVPPVRDIARGAAAASSAIAGAAVMMWEELALELATSALQLSNAESPTHAVPRGAEARVSASVRAIERAPADAHTIESLAERAALSPFHYLRTFQRVTGITPHQFIVRSRLRSAAMQLASTRARIVDVAYSSGFGDLSNFNHAFRAEFGETPRQYRRR